MGRASAAGFGTGAKATSGVAIGGSGTGYGASLTASGATASMVGLATSALTMEGSLF